MMGLVIVEVIGLSYYMQHIILTTDCKQSSECIMQLSHLNFRWFIMLGKLKTSKNSHWPTLY